MSNKTKFTPATGAAIVIANMIGTGVFTSLGFQLLDIKSGFVILLLWILGGVIAISGALCYAELGARLPRSGGEYHFFSQIYHTIRWLGLSLAACQQRLASRHLPHWLL